MRIALGVEYDGSAFRGWQTQPGGQTVQDALEAAMRQIAGERVDVVCAGRTDAGVHARKMIAHFDFSGERFDEKDLVRNLNSFLSRDIAVHEIREVKPDAHARFSATSRT